MQINVFMERVNKNNKIEIDEYSSLKDLLKELKINPVTVIVTKKDELIPEKEK